MLCYRFFYGFVTSKIGRVNREGWPRMRQKVTLGCLEPAIKQRDPPRIWHFLYKALVSVGKTKTSPKGLRVVSQK